MRVRTLFRLSVFAASAVAGTKLAQAIKKHADQDQDDHQLIHWQLELWEIYADFAQLVSKPRFSEPWWLVRLDEELKRLSGHYRVAPEVVKQFEAGIHSLRSTNQALVSARLNQDGVALRDGAKELHGVCVQFNDYFTDLIDTR